MMNDAVISDEGLDPAAEAAFQRIVDLARNNRRAYARSRQAENIRKPKRPAAVPALTGAPAPVVKVERVYNLPYPD
jgi:hypothetical protein